MQKKPTEKPTKPLDNYELVVPYEGDEAGALEFAGEIVTEFGCRVMVIDQTTGEDLYGRPLHSRSE